MYFAQRFCLVLPFLAPTTSGVTMVGLVSPGAATDGVTLFFETDDLVIALGK